MSGTGDTTIFSPTTDGFAVSVWVNFEYTADPSETAYIASVWNYTQWPTGSAWHIFAAPDCGWVSAEVLGQISGFNGLSGPGDLSGWAHICLVFYPLANQWSLYVNGALVATVDCDYRPVAGRLGVGLHTNPITPPPDCRVDELAIWSRDLSASEVAQLYNNGNGLPFELF